MLLYNSGDTLIYGDTPIYFFNIKVTQSNFSKIKKKKHRHLDFVLNFHWLIKKFIDTLSIALQELLGKITS